MLIKLYIQIEEYRSVLTTQIERVVRFFQKNPNYGGIKQIKTDLHLIEVCNAVRLHLFVKLRRVMLTESRYD